MIGAILRHTGVLIALGLLGMTAFVLTIIGVLMARAGASLRPIAWFGGFMLIVVLPQLAVHTWDAIRLTRLDARHLAAIAAAPGRDAGNGPAGAANAEPSAALEQLFGADVDPRLVLDARTSLADVLGTAEVARFAAFPSGESVILARFRSERHMERAWIAYLASAGLRSTAIGDSRRGFVASRAAGDRVYVLPMRTMLGIWSGADDSTIRARMTAGGFAVPVDAPLGGAGLPVSTTAAIHADTAPLTTTAGAPAPIAGDALPPWANLTILFGVLIIVVPYFFKGAAWAAATPRVAVAPVSTDELRARLLAINDLDVPFAVVAEPGSSVVEVTWRYGDAKWADHARVHGMRRMHRIVLRLDAANRIARVTDFAANYDWSAGGGGARIDWRAMTGITFFERRQQRVFGLQLSGDGAFTSDFSYSYRFDLQEMKAPLISAVTQAGWDWRPVMWGSAPAWLRWLTE